MPLPDGAGEVLEARGLSRRLWALRIGATIMKKQYVELFGHPEELVAHSHIPSKYGTLPSGNHICTSQPRTMLVFPRCTLKILIYPHRDLVGLVPLVFGRGWSRRDHDLDHAICAGEYETVFENGIEHRLLGGTRPHNRLRLDIVKAIQELGSNSKAAPPSWMLAMDQKSQDDDIRILLERLTILEHQRTKKARKRARISGKKGGAPLKDKPKLITAAVEAVKERLRNNPTRSLGLRLPPQKRRDRTLAIVYNRGHEINNQYQREALDP